MRVRRVPKSVSPLLLLLWLLAVGIGFLSIGFGFYSIEQEAAARAEQEANDTLKVQMTSLLGVLDRFRALAPMLSRQQGVQHLFAAPVSSEERRAKVTELAYLSGAADVALYGVDGAYITSARGLYQAGLQANAVTAELLKAPFEARLGRAILLADAAAPVYAFSALVGGVNAPVGVLVFFVDLSAIEQTWALSRLPIFVTDARKIIILSSVTELRGKAMRQVVQGDAQRLLHLPNGSQQPVQMRARYLPLLRWRIHVAGIVGDLAASRQLLVLISLLLTLLIGMGGTMLLRRSGQAEQRDRKKRADAIRLERLVARRTRDLNVSNLSLQLEIEERKAAEQKLLKAQEEVVRSAKLAAIGQMSATLSHEYNQPLAAIASYAENAQTFLQRDNTAAAANNLQLIQQQVLRMGALSRTLLTFARRADQERHPVRVKSIVDDVVMLVAPRAKKDKVELEVGPIDADWQVMGSQIRLTQVLINLLNNAIDASVGRDNAQVRLSCEMTAQHCQLTVSDNGTGVPSAIADKIFEPFFTTKPAGSGLGIGLSVVADIVKEYNGEISVHAAPGGGARFCVKLERVMTQQAMELQ